MYDKHWSDEQLVSHLYGVGPEDGHLETCPSCVQRWELVRRRHENRRSACAEVPAELLAAQRRAIQAGLGEKRHSFRRVLVPVLVTVLLAVVVILSRHAPTPPPAAEKVTDSQLFDDVFSKVSGTEPIAISPIRSLFEERK
jgi:hypothetical protein